MTHISASEYQLFLRSDLMSFIHRSFYELNPQTTFSNSPHIEMIASKLEACRQGKIKRLIINLPPRSLKSHCASIAFPAWLLGHNPAEQIICVSYGQELSDKLARDCRTLMASEWYRRLFPETRLSPSKQSTSEYETTAQGCRLSTSTGGTLTGRGANFIIIDDPLKPVDALSETQRKGCNEWFDNTLLSRLNDKTEGCIIVIMQRLHQDDLVGHVLEQEGWEVLSFPAIAEEDEVHVIESPLGQRLYSRLAGEALHPVREPLATLRKISDSLGSYNFSSQYQQNPIPIGGNIVKPEWFGYYDLKERREGFSYVLLSLDTANKAKELNDYSVATIWGYRRKKFYLLHVFRKRLNYPELKQAIKQLAKEYRVNKILIEDKASGTPLIQDLKRDGVIGVVAYEPPAVMDKIMRLHAQTAVFESGMVLLPQEAPWLEEYVKELIGFPGTKFDDQVDSTAQALDYMKSKCALLVWERLAD